MQQRIAIFGGSFDPVHLGHIGMAEEAHRREQLDRVIFLPCLRSPHKPDRPGATPEQRAAMIEIAVRELPWAEVSRWEIERSPPSYSWMAAEHFHSAFPEAELYWIMGNDQWRVLERWARPDRLATLLTFIVFTRGEQPSEKAGFHWSAVDHRHPASSTEIRERVAREEDCSDMLDPGVAAYIAEHGLYSPVSPTAT